MGEYYRLSSDVVPLHYTLYLEPDLEESTFTGKVKIDLLVKERVDEVVVNAHNFNKLSVNRLIKLGNRCHSSELDTTAKPTSKDKSASKDDPVSISETEHVAKTKKKEGLAAKISDILSRSPERKDDFTGIIKRKRDENEGLVFAKRSKPCPGRFRKKSESDDNEEDGDESEDGISSPTRALYSDHESSAPTSPAQEPKTRQSDSSGEDGDSSKDGDGSDDDDDDDGTEADDTKVVASSSRDQREEKKETGNDNVKAASSGILLLRSEWAGPEGESSDEDDYAAQRFIESDKNSDSDQNNQDDNRSDYDSRDEDEGGYVLSSDDDDDDDQRDNDVCYVRDEDESDDDVMQVDGAADSSDEDEPVDVVGEDSSPEKLPETEEETDTLNLQLEHDEEEVDKDKEERKDHKDKDQNEDMEEKDMPEEGKEMVESKSLEVDDGENKSEQKELSRKEIEQDKMRSEGGEDTKDGLVEDEQVSENKENAEMDVSEDKSDESNEQTSNAKDHDEDEEPSEDSHETEGQETIEEEPVIIEDVELEVTKEVFLTEKQVLLISTDTSLDPGNYTLEIEFAGILDDSLRGFYRTKHKVNGEERWGAACHFEATGARKCFPCIDQPEFRSTFDISVKRPNKQVEVLSNMPAVDEDVDGIIKFARTPKIPSYLICLVIGYYDSISRRSECGVEINAFAQTGQVLQAQYALDIATRALTFYQDFFGVSYNLPKMDLVAVPDFYIGAMENWGLLTFRETALLFHPNHSTLSRRQYVAILVCHEMAHQWFGNLVSVAWWDQIWLKEGFATWISFLAVDHLFPEFDIWSDFLTTEQMRALRLDSLDSSHPIQVKVNDPGQIDEIFDTISYCKGASIIHMLFHWIGEKAFKAGMNLYLTKHGGSSASTEDLWAALDAVRDSVSRRSTDSPSVASVMNEWTTLQGYPTLCVSKRDGRYVLRQTSRYNHTWKLPIKAFNSDVAVVLEHEEHEFNIDVAGFPLINVGQAAYCRVYYDWDTVLGNHLSDIYDLAPRDKAGILMNLLLNFTRSGDERIDHVLDLVSCYAGETDWVVVDALLNVLDDIESLVKETKAWAGYLHLAYSLLTSILDKVGWNAEGLSGNLSLTQGAVINRLGLLGHSDTCGEATLLWRREERGGPAVSNSIRPAVYRTVAKCGAHREKDYFINMYRKADRNEEKRMLLTVLGSFTNTEIMKELLDWSMTDEVKLQDRVFIFGCISETGLEGRSMVFKFFQDNFDSLSKQYTSGSLLTRLVAGVIKNFNTTSDLHKINKFFKKNDVSGAHRTIEQCCEDIQLLVNARDKYQESILEYFSRNSRSEVEFRG